MSDVVRAAVLVVSTSRAESGEPGETGEGIVAALGGIGIETTVTEVVADDRGVIADALRRHAAAGVDLIVTAGGTGFTPDDLTPEATRDVIDREAPGLAEAMRGASRESTPNWWLSRGIAGTLGNTLIANFPGSPKAVPDCVGAIADGLPHAIGHLRGGHEHGGV